MIQKNILLNFNKKNKKNKKNISIKFTILLKKKLNEIAI
jgi:hypothetical protein